MAASDLLSLGICVDLTPSVTTASDDNHLLATLQTQMTKGTTAGMLSDDEAAQIDDWLNQIKAAQAAFYQTIAAELSPLDDEVNALAPQWNMDLFKIVIARFVASDDNIGSKWVTPTQAPTLAPSDNALYIYDQDDTPYFYGADIGSYVDYTSVLGAPTPPAHPKYTGPITGAAYAAQVVKATSQLASQRDDLFEQITAINNQVPPGAPPFPILQGDDYTKFEYSPITISGDDWSYDL